MPKLIVYQHAQINISNTRPFFCLPDFQLCVSGTENRQVSRSQACCSTSHYFNTAGTGEEHNRGKFVHQSEQRLNQYFQPIRVHHLHDLSHVLLGSMHNTMYDMCNFGCILNYMTILLYGCFSSKTSNKGNFCYLGNLIKKQSLHQPIHPNLPELILVS